MIGSTEHCAALIDTAASRSLLDTRSKQKESEQRFGAGHERSQLDLRERHRKLVCSPLKEAYELNGCSDVRADELRERAMVDSAAYEKHSSFSCWTPVVKVGRIPCPGLDLLAGGDGFKDVGHKFPERHYDMTATIGIIGAERLLRTKPNSVDYNAILILS